MEKEIDLKEFNNIQDSPNIFLKMINSLINNYKLELSKMGEMNADNRNFECVLVGDTDYIELFYDYEESKLKYKIYSKDNLLDNEIEAYILKVINKTSYKKDEIVTDIYGNKYRVLEDYIPNEPKNGGQLLKKIKLCDLKTNNIVSFSGSMVAQL
ncbi:MULTISPECIES: hypothetical protein [Clostridium]|uniref:hypothetical protein n=1 Tax=Clostridium sporogenes TaxID=1509 RepID=UPI0013D45F51|nr:hypothetical protein [Clostridium sporogenes]NFF75934.1 hypothetical protein [Clostridium sporogenes]NFH40834.1 hypothetical protein [Clostridium sporogenes]